MANSLLPTQIGFLQQNTTVTPALPSGQFSTLVLGRNITSGFQSVGFGANGQPDILQELIINISDKDNANPLTETPIIIKIGVNPLYNIVSTNTNAPFIFEIKIKEVSICEIDDETGESVEKRMVVLASQTYLPAPTA